MPKVSSAQMKAYIGNGHFTPKSLKRKSSKYNAREVFVITGEKKVNKLLTFFNLKLLFRDASDWVQRLHNGKAEFTCSCSKRDIEEMIEQNETMRYLYNKALLQDPFMDNAMNQMIEDLNTRLSALDEPAPVVNYSPAKQSLIEETRERFLSQIAETDEKTRQKIEKVSLADVEVLREIEDAIIHAKQELGKELIDHKFFVIKFPVKVTDETAKVFQMLFSQEVKEHPTTVYLKFIPSKNNDDRCLVGKQRLNLDPDSYLDILTKIFNDPSFKMELYR